MDATVRGTNTPGLFDVETADGQTFTDLTFGQLQQVVARLGLRPQLHGEATVLTPGGPVSLIGRV